MFEKKWFIFRFLIGIIFEIIVDGWILFPLSWLIICTIELGEIIVRKIKTIDEFFNLIYNIFSIILMAIGILFNFWILSWTALFFSLAVTWFISKFKLFK